jgi:ribose 5-phosphate isomerase B
MTRPLIGPEHVRAAVGGVLRIDPDAIVSPYAEDEAIKRGVRFERSGAAPANPDAVALGADHGGFELKERVKKHLESRGHLVLDVGTHSKEAVDYPDLALKVALAVRDGAARAGVMIDGAGIGSAMAANKVAGIRAAKCDSLFDVKNSREHNHANVLTLGARLDPALACEMVEVWLATPFGGDRHARRVEKITQIERTQGKCSSPA